MAKLRSSPAAIKPIQNRSGSWSYRVTATIAGHQRKKVMQSLAEAEELQEIWENERIHGAAAVRPKMTWMEKAQLKDAEAAVLVIKPTGFSLLQAAQLMAGFDQARLQDIQKALRLADGEPFSISVTKYDKMEFQNLVLAAGPVQIYPEVTVNGSMIYDYGRSAWYFHNVNISYSVDGRLLQDKLTGNIRWVGSANPVRAGV